MRLQVCESATFTSDFLEFIIIAYINGRFKLNVKMKKLNQFLNTNMAHLSKFYQKLPAAAYIFSYSVETLKHLANFRTYNKYNLKLSH